MDAPGLPSFQLVMTGRVIAAVHPDFWCGMAAVPDGMRWLAPQSLSRTRSAADLLGFANRGQLVASLVDEIGHWLGHIDDAPGHDQTEFTEQAADLIGLRGARFDEALAHSV
jgi:hypothetical protein